MESANTNQQSPSVMSFVSPATVGAAGGLVSGIITKPKYFGKIQNLETLTSETIDEFIKAAKESGLTVADNVKTKKFNILAKHLKKYETMWENLIKDTENITKLQKIQPVFLNTKEQLFNIIEKYMPKQSKFGIILKHTAAGLALGAASMIISDMIIGPKK
jgi:hypothetical protein